MDNKLYDLKSVSIFTKLSVRTLRRLIATGVLKGTKIDDRKWMFSVEQIYEFFQNSKAFPCISSKGKSIAVDWLLGMHGVSNKCFSAFTFNDDNDEPKVYDVLRILIEQSIHKSIKVHYGKYNGVIHIAYFGDRNVVKEAIEELHEKSAID